MFAAIAIAFSPSAALAAKRDSVIYGWPSDPSNLGACCQIYDGSIREEKDGTLAPALCESYEITNGNKDIVFRLRQGVKFHNGDTLTAEDVVFSLNRSIGSPATTKITSAFDRAEKIDDKTVVLHLKYPYGGAIGCLSNGNCYIVNKKVVEADEKRSINDPVGTGPYMVTDWKAGVEMNLQAFPDYFRGEASIDKLTFRTISDSQALVIALQNGEIDFLDTPIITARQTLIDDHNIRYDQTNQAAYYLIAFNNKKGHFTNKLLRSGQRVQHREGEAADGRGRLS